MERCYKVFISSTYAGLQAERREAIDAVLSFGYIPAGMLEFGTASSQCPLYGIRPLPTGMKPELTWNSFCRGIEILKEAMLQTPGRIRPDLFFGINETGMMLAGYLKGTFNHDAHLGMVRTGMEHERKDKSTYREKVYSYPAETEIEQSDETQFIAVADRDIKCIALVDSEIKSGSSIKAIRGKLREKYPGVTELIYIVLVGVIGKEKMESAGLRDYISSSDFGSRLSGEYEEYKPDFIAFYTEEPGAEPPGRLH